MFLRAKCDNDQKAQACIEQIKSDKEQKLKEVVMLFDEHIKAISEQNMQVNSDIDNSVAEIDANIEKIEDLERNGDSTTSVSMILAIKDIQERTQALSRQSVVNSYEYERNRDGMLSVPGQLKQTELLLNGKIETAEGIVTHSNTPENTDVSMEQEDNSRAGNKDVTSIYS